VMKGLPAAGVDIIELGLPFTDPMADGSTIQLAGQRALEGGQTLALTLQYAREFRKDDATTPIVLMGYSRGVDRFLEEAVAAGIDGLIIVDLPPEEDSELCIPAQAAGINFIVGSAIVERIAAGDSVADVLAFVKSLADGAHRG